MLRFLNNSSLHGTYLNGEAAVYYIRKHIVSESVTLPRKWRIYSHDITLTKMEESAIPLLIYEDYDHSNPPPSQVSNGKMF
jgi:hypothetical protein